MDGQPAPGCKCCGGPTRRFGAVDAARSCEDRRGGPVFAPTGVLVAYWRCRTCGFVFTRDLDALSEAEMAERIYNADYARADPDFADSRPRLFAGLLAGRLAPLRGSLVVLDYGGGQGLLAALMRAQGFHYDSFDPYFDGTARPHGSYDLVTAFEVMEHSRTPLATFHDALAALRPGGTLLFSTQLVPRGADAGWWYLGPRNGHVSLHSDRSLAVCARACGMDSLSLDSGLHLFLPRAPDAAAHVLANGRLEGALYAASLRGAWAFLHTARLALRFGRSGRVAVLSPRHPLRAALAELGLVRRHWA